MISEKRDCLYKENKQITEFKKRQKFHTNVTYQVTYQARPSRTCCEEGSPSYANQGQEDELVHEEAVQAYLKAKNLAFKSKLNSFVEQYRYTLVYEF